MRSLFQYYQNITKTNQTIKNPITFELSNKTTNQTKKFFK